MLLRTMSARDWSVFTLVSMTLLVSVGGHDRTSRAHKEAGGGSKLTRLQVKLEYNQCDKKIDFFLLISKFTLSKAAFICNCFSMINICIIHRFTSSAFHGRISRHPSFRKLQYTSNLRISLLMLTSL